MLFEFVVFFALDVYIAYTQGNIYSNRQEFTKLKKLSTRNINLWGICFTSD